MSRLRVALIGERDNYITNRMLVSLLKLDNVSLTFFIDATLKTEKRVNLYDENPVLPFRIAARLRKLVSRKHKRIDNFEVCQNQGVRIVQPTGNNLNTGIDEKFFSEPLDYILVAGCDQILKQRIISWPKKHIINYHYSPLPAYRGKFSLFWQWYNDEPEVGYTYHEINEGIDTGRILLQGKIKNTFAEDYFGLFQTVVGQSADRLGELFELLENDLTLTLDEDIQESYYPSKMRHTLNYITPDITVAECKKRLKKLGRLRLSREMTVTGIQFSNCGNVLKKNLLSVCLPLVDGNVVIKGINFLPARFFFKKIQQIWHTG